MQTSSFKNTVNKITWWKHKQSEYKNIVNTDDLYTNKQNKQKKKVEHKIIVNTQTG